MTLQQILINAFSGETASLFVGAFCMILCMALPYVLGSVNFALVISKTFYHDDIRKYGSKNAGMTNMLRTYGKGAALATLLCDMLKGALATLFGCFVYGHFFGGYLAGLFCVIGHIFPVFFKFRGGKGVATVAAVILTLDPLCFAILFAVFLIVVISTRYVSLGSVICMMAYPIVTYRIYAPAMLAGDNEPYGFSIMFTFMVAAIVIFMHRTNLARLKNHTESKISFSKKKK